MDYSHVSSLLQTRAAGVLLHVSSLPGKHGIGDLGANAYAFVDWLAECGVGWWQVLPLNPNGRGFSPYCSWSAFCGNPLFVDLEGLHKQGFLEASDLATVPAFPQNHVDFPAVEAFKEPLLHKAAQRLLEGGTATQTERYKAFCEANASWLEDAILFFLLRREQGGKPWWEWEKPLRDREPKRLSLAKQELGFAIEREKAIQFFFEEQWNYLKKYANDKGVRLVGDVAIYVDGDSADVWAHQESFKLDTEKKPTCVSGVPPDAFSDLGQLWGNPIYDWKHLASKGYAWWIQRFARSLAQTDIVRIDHFRGFSAYWEIPHGSPDARTGRWVPGPGHDFIRTLKKAFNGLPFIAEDLGVIDDDVESLRDEHNLPGMLILQFAFGGKATNEYLPHNAKHNRLMYPGTHDNETALGWWRNISEDTRAHVENYLGIVENEYDFVWKFIRLALGSVANFAVIPMQDILCLGNEARMNNPAVSGQTNWQWRMNSDVQFGRHLGERFSGLLKLYARDRLFVNKYSEKITR